MSVYAKRLGTWIQVLSQIEGAARPDQAIIIRSARRGMLGAIHDLDEWRDPVLVEDASVEVKHVGRFQIRADCDDLYHVLPAREASVMRTIVTLLEYGDTFIDAGANIGFFTVLAANRVGNLGKVIAIEMMPETGRILRNHIALNELGNVEVVEKALSDQPGQIAMAWTPARKFGQASIIDQQTRSAADPNKIEVLTTTLDEIAGIHSGPIALIKMDLEGAEHLALLGASGTLQRTKAVIFEQLGNDDRARQLLIDCGFGIRALDGNNLLAQMSFPEQ